MASAIVFLVYACTLLPPLTTQEEIKDNSDGKRCVFPFIYLGKTYFNCTTKNSLKPWCAMTGNYDKHKIWRYCTDKKIEGNSDGKRCVFPFIYLGKTYFNCTTKNSLKPWCATTGNYDKHKIWKYCADTEIKDNSDGKHCVFPFIYLGKTYFNCTTKNSLKPWCATTGNYDKHKIWKYCADTDYEGNSDGEYCVFPFIYLGKTYFNCTTKNSLKPWCATTGNFDRDKIWRYCTETKIKDKCIFPFTYGNKTYSTCTEDGAFLGRFWCSLTSDFDAHPEWKYCDSSDLKAACSQQS